MRATRHSLLVLLAAALVTSLGGCRRSTALLDHRALLERQGWWENRDFEWYERNIPFFESPDTALDATYYYRWELVTRHLTYGAPATGYTFTEFIDRPFWSGAYGAISCPLGHQLYETRWLKDPRYAEDFARYWFTAPGAQPRSYSNWYGDAVWATYLVNGDSAFLRSTVPFMLRQYEGWMAEHWDAEHRMFQWDGLHDGMEVGINAVQTADEQEGAPGFRPTLNSYLYADARAIAQASALFGDTGTAREYTARAADLKSRVQQELWDPRREFFLHQSARDEPNGIRRLDLTYESGRLKGDPHGRELIGYVPWQFSLPDSGYEAAWRFLMDTAHFAAPFGPTTAERGDPLFAVSPTCCVWRGNAWPYATAQTLTAMANLLNGYRQSYVTAEDYATLLRQYARAQRKNGRPYIAEAADPFTGSFAGHDTWYHSEHYFHSSFTDLVITGLSGLRPRGDDTLEVNPLVPAAWDWFALDDVAYRGRRVSILWDRDGRKYGRGKGLTVWVNGRRAAQQDSIGRMLARMEPATPLPPVVRQANLAVNNGRGVFPRITASWSAPRTPPFYLNDGHVWFDREPPDRWTSVGSPNAADTVTLEFGIIRPVDEVTLHFLEDGDSVRPPARYSLEYLRNREWRPVPGQSRSPSQAEGRRANHITFPRIETSTLRAVLTHRPRAASGMSEFEAWTRVPGPFPGPAATPTPAVSASFTSQYDRVEQAVDSRIAYTRYSRNRWSAYGTPNASDWLALAFDRPRRVSQIEIHFVADGRGLAAPAAYHVQVWDGTRWTDAVVRRRLPERPEAWAMNTVWIDPVETRQVRVVFDHARPAATAVTELTIRDDADPQPTNTVTREPFGLTPAGDTVERIILTNAHGAELRAMTYGAIITHLLMPGRDGTLGDVVLGYDSLAGYVSSSPYFGAVVGRYGNRIAKGRFTLDGRTHQLAVNNGPNHLHGGLRGFDKVVWRAETFRKDGVSGVTFRYTSPDGEEGYPGNLTASVTYTLSDSDLVTISYEATTDAATPVNLTQHSYFNLRGKGDILGHRLALDADRFAAVDSTLIPTGALVPVAGTPFDFTSPHAIGERIGAPDQQLRFGGGYDHTFVLIRTGAGLARAARVVEPESGRTLAISTTEPGVQFYTGNFLDGSLTGKNGTVYAYRTGFCLETQHFPDSPNHPAFPNTILRPGETYRSMTTWQFGTDRAP